MTTGSSPLTRGKRLPVRFPHHGVGLIPAHAGKTGRAWAGQVSPGAHPRSRGENVEPLNGVAVHEGSSPLTRGKRAFALDRVGAQGLIPAHAGKTSPMGSSCRHTRAHPRSRGENSDASPYLPPGRGSSPLTRGKQFPLIFCPFRPGLIPAHAGKTCMALPRRGCDRAHPRSRGENGVVSSARATVAGSSPLTRGKHLQPAQLHRRPGLIPAHAGKTKGGSK